MAVKRVRAASILPPSSSRRSLSPLSIAGTATTSLGLGLYAYRRTFSSSPLLADSSSSQPQSWWDSMKSKLDTGLSDLRSRYSQLTTELSQDEGSLYRTVVDKDRWDEQANPEVGWRAKVRLGTGVSQGEKAFLRDRKRAMRTSFAKLVGVNEDDVDERDVPVVAIAGSGGGYRAMASTLGSLLGAKNSGILDCTSYVSAISGSCWAVAIWLSIAGGDLEKAQKHVKDRIVTAFLDMDNFKLFIDEPTNRYLLSGAIIKASAKGGTTSLVDIYGTLVSSRLFVPSDLSLLSPSHLKLSNQRGLVEEGKVPMPIYCAIRHDVPDMAKVAEVEKERAEVAVKGRAKEGGEKDKEERLEKERDKWLERQSYQWFEITPYEFGSEELGAFIPTWSLGRLFNSGRDAEARPEMSLTVLSGVFASAFTATLAHYYKEVKPALMALPFAKAIDGYVSAFNEDLALLHPFPPAELPNPLKGLDGDLRPGSPDGITESDTLGLMDAGAELNIPYVPLYRRGVDVVIALDASADSQDLWFEKAGVYAGKAGVKGWPRVKYKGPFPQTPEAPGGDETEKNRKGEPPSAGQEGQKDGEEGKAEGEKGEAEGKKAKGGSEGVVDEASSQAEDERRVAGPESGKGSSSSTNPYPSDTLDGPVKNSSSEREGRGEAGIGRCNIWVGDSKMGEDESARMDEVDEEAVEKRDGPGLVYIPLVPGEGLDNPAETWSTWRFEYSEEETAQLLKLSEGNFRSGEEEIKNLMRAMWKRKRRMRLEGEQTASVGEDEVAD